MCGYLCIAIVIGFMMISLTAIGFWSASVIVMEDQINFGTLYGAALAYYPAMLVMIGIAALLIGWLPKIASIIWLLVIYSFVVLYFGGLFQFPNWVGKLSPFGYIPQLPIEDMEWIPVIILSTLAIGLMIGGLIGYNKRDIEG